MPHPAPSITPRRRIVGVLLGLLMLGAIVGTIYYFVRGHDAQTLEREATLLRSQCTAMLGAGEGASVEALCEQATSIGLQQIQASRLSLSDYLDIEAYACEYVEAQTCEQQKKALRDDFLLDMLILSACTHDTLGVYLTKPTDGLITKRAQAVYMPGYTVYLCDKKGFLNHAFSDYTQANIISAKELDAHRHPLAHYFVENDYPGFVQAIEDGAPIESDAEARLSPLSLASAHPDARFFNHLLTQGARINTDINYYEQPLSAALGACHPERARQLLQRGADPLRPDLSHNSPITLAAACTDPALVMELHERGADIEGRRGTPLPEHFKHDTPLMFAARAGDLNMTRLLLDKGARLDVGAASDYSRRLMDYAVEGGNTQLIRELQQRGVGMDNRGNRLIRQAIANFDPLILKTLYDLGMRFDKEAEYDEETPHPIIQIIGLLPSEMNAEAQGEYPEYDTRGFFDIVMDNGIDPGYRRDSATLLHTLLSQGLQSDGYYFFSDDQFLRAYFDRNAAFLEHATQRLLEAGVDPNLGDANGLTALHYAVHGAHPGIVERLLKAGADPTRRDDYDHDARDWIKRDIKRTRERLDESASDESGSDSEQRQTDEARQHTNRIILELLENPAYAPPEITTSVPDKKKPSIERHR